MSEIRDIRFASAVSEEILAHAEEVWDDHFLGKRINWERFIDLLSDTYGPTGNPPYEFLDYDSPAVRKIQRHIRNLAAEGEK